MAKNPERQPTDIPAELKSFEARLGSLTPAAARMNRDRVMYLAGAAAASVRARQADVPSVPVAASRGRFVRFKTSFWPLTTAALALVSLGLGTRLAWQERPAPSTEAARTSPGLARTAGNGSHAAGFEIPNVARLEPSYDAGVKGDPANYLVLREKVLRLGVDSLDDPAAATVGGSMKSGDARNRVLLHQLLGS